MRKTSISNLLKDFQIKSLTGIFLDLNSWNSENYFIVLHQGAIISQIIKEFQFLLISDGGFFFFFFLFFSICFKKQRKPHMSLENCYKEYRVSNFVPRVSDNFKKTLNVYNTRNH